MTWNKGRMLQESKERLRRANRERKMVDRKHGKTIDSFKQLNISESRECELVALNIRIKNYYDWVESITIDQVSRELPVILSELTAIIESYDGEVVQLSDGRIMALFISRSNRYKICQNAIDSALSVLTIMKYSIGPYFKSQFNCGAGIDFGYVWVEMIVTRYGQQLCLNGNTMRISADLEKLAQQNQILVGKDVYLSIDEEEKQRCKLQQIDRSWKWKCGNEQYPYYLYLGIWNKYPLNE